MVFYLWHFVFVGHKDEFVKEKFAIKIERKVKMLNEQKLSASTFTQVKYHVPHKICFSHYGLRILVFSFKYRGKIYC